MCVLLCSCKLVFLANALSHWSHSYGFILECTLICCFSLLGFLNTALHSGHSFILLGTTVFSSGLFSISSSCNSSLECMFVLCFFNCDFLVKDSLQREHEKRSRLEWESSCLFPEDLSLKALPHMLHLYGFSPVCIT